MTSQTFSSSMGDEQRLNLRFKLRRFPSIIWTARNEVLLAGEPGVETDTDRFKIGDGVTPWNDLPYYLNENAISALVAEMIAASPGGGGGVSAADLEAHIEAENPHPVYDDGTTFTLRYENAKV